MHAPLCFDLHCHSTASDGELSPTEVVRRAARQGVDVLALTDHDVTDGVAEARREAGHQGLHLVAGVEISVTWGRHLVHIVGLGIDPAQPALQQGLAVLRERRIRRAQQIAEKLARAGVPDAWQGALEYAGGEVISRTHFARYLVACGAVRDQQAAFKRYLSRGKRAYAAVEWASLADAVGWINAAGGQAVIAHPARYRMGQLLLRELIDEFRAVGGAAIEVLSSSHSPREARTIAELAGQSGLLASCGSDFHGPGNPWAELGRLPALPAGCEPVWRDWDLGRLAVGS